MPVMIDDEPLAAEQMGLRTIGQVLAHVQREKRLVTNLLIDGLEPDLGDIGIVRRSPLIGHTVYIETSDPRAMAIEVLTQVELQLQDADQIRADVIELLGRNQPGKAMEKLGGCFSAWQLAQESILKISQLLRIDLEGVCIDGRPMLGLLEEFARQLREIKSSLENRDFVTLSDILTYEATETSARWGSALDAIRGMIDLV